MKEVRQSICMVFPWDVLNSIFGEQFWNDHEDVYLIPVNRIIPYEWEKFEKAGFDVDKLKDASYFVAEGDY